MYVRQESTVAPLLPTPYAWCTYNMKLQQAHSDGIILEIETKIATRVVSWVLKIFLED